MSKNLLETTTELEKWLGKQSKPLKWAIAVSTGRYESDAWHPFTGLDGLPKGKKLILRATDGKGGIHVLLPIVAGELMPPGEDVRTYALSPRSVAFLRSLKVWDGLVDAHATPVQDMRVRGDLGAVVRAAEHPHLRHRLVGGQVGAHGGTPEFRNQVRGAIGQRSG